jgi:hypothetical protein
MHLHRLLVQEQTIAFSTPTSNTESTKLTISLGMVQEIHLSPSRENSGVNTVGQIGETTSGTFISTRQTEVLSHLMKLSGSTRGKGRCSETSALR